MTILRILGLACGLGLMLLSVGMVPAWRSITIGHEIILLVAGIFILIASVWKWKIHFALTALGLTLIAGGAIVFFAMPNVVNNGSGQDAVALFATVGGGGAAVVGVLLVIFGGVSATVRR